MKYKKDENLQEFLEETYKWFANVFREEIKFDKEGNLYTVPVTVPVTAPIDIPD